MKTIYENDNVIVRASPISGLGVFAIRDVSKGALVASWEHRRLLSEKEYAALTSAEKSYCTKIRGVYEMLPIPARYINHSCEPNVEARESGDVAIQNIASGEEITADYALEYPPGYRLNCRCGKPTCRKIVMGINSNSKGLKHGV